MANNLISIKEVCSRTSLSRTAIYKHRAAGNFPAQVFLGEKRIAFVAEEIDEWIQKRIDNRSIKKECAV